MGFSFASVVLSGSGGCLVLSTRDLHETVALKGSQQLLLCHDRRVIRTVLTKATGVAHSLIPPLKEQKGRYASIRQRPFREPRV